MVDSTARTAKEIVTKRDDDVDLCDSLGEDLLQDGPALLQGVGRYLHCEDSGLAGMVSLLCRDGDLDRNNTVGVRGN